ncbi:MAG: mercury transporter MerT [Rhodothermales bacterium]|nr:mercury transporter MerT [Rhodothermales bacterium]
MNRDRNYSDWSLVGAVGAAVGASACCTIPLALVSLGIGGAWVSNLIALQSYRPFFVVLALGLLAVAFYQSNRSASDVDCACETEGILSRRTKQILMLAGVVASLLLILSPWLLASAGGNSVSTTVATETSNIESAVLEIEGMTCASCTTTVSIALSRIDGVVEAQVSYEPPIATVRYDASRLTVDDLLSATANAGYPSSLRRESDTGS